MRAIIILAILLGVGYLLVDHLQHPTASSTVVATPMAASPAELAAIFPEAQTPSAPSVATPTEADYLAWGVPSLNDGWDAPTLKKICVSLGHIKAKNPANLPGAQSAYGKAFFSKLRHTAQHFHLLSPSNKVASGNAFDGLLPLYIGARKSGVQCDMEMALLIGLHFELLAGFAEDPLFVKSLSQRSHRISRDLDGNTLIASSAVIYRDANSWLQAHEINTLLDLLADPAAFRPEARILGLSHVSLHLPTIARRMELTGIVPTLIKNQANETNAQARAYYATLIARLS